MHIVEPAKAKKPLLRSKFRRKAMTDEERRERKAQEKRDEEERMRALARHDLRAPDKPRQPPVMLIDAYNLMNMDATIRSYMAVSETLEFARGELERRVQLYAGATGTQCIIAYDAMGQYSNGRRSQDRTERLDDRVTVVFSASREADSYIVSTAQLLKEQGRDKIEVVSNDKRVQMECSDLHDFVIYSVDAAKFVQDLQECAKGNFDGVHARWPLPSSNNAEYFERMRAQHAAAAERQAQVKLPEVSAPAVEHKLVQELERIEAESSSDSDSEGPWAGGEVAGQAAPAVAKGLREDSTDLSAGLNSLLTPTSSVRKRRRL